MDRFSRVCLLLIVLLLAVIAFRPMVSPGPVQAAKKHQYLYEQAEAVGGVQASLDKHAADGWELLAPIYSGDTMGVFLIFRK